MESTPFLEAAGAYAEELGHELGWLMLQASVLAGLRMRDDTAYSPDTRLVPSESGRLYSAIRDLIPECAMIERLAEEHLEASTAKAFQVSTRVDCWQDPIPLAQVATWLRPRDPLAKVTLACALFRDYQDDEALEVLSGCEECAQFIDGALIRILRTRACIAEVIGDNEQAVALIMRAKRLDQSNRITALSALALSVSCGEYDGVRSALQQVRDSRSRPEMLQIAKFLTRKNTLPFLRLQSDSDMHLIVASYLDQAPEYLLSTEAVCNAS